MGEGVRGYSMTATRVFFLSLVLGHNALAAQERVRFEIRDPETRELYFRGEEIRSRQAGEIRKETLFRDARGQATHREVTHYRAKDHAILKYGYEDYLTGGETSIVKRGSELETRYREAKGSDLREAALPEKPDLLATSVVEEWVRARWSLLLTQRKLRFALLFPQRGQSIDFQVRVQESPQAGAEELIVIVAEPRNLVLRWLAPPIEFSYRNPGTPRLVRFRGPSPTPIKGQKNKILDIFFF